MIVKGKLHMQQATGPNFLTEYILRISKEKINKALLKLILQGILAGIYISIAAIGYFKLTATIVDPGLAAFFGALVFPLGIIAIIIMHGELYTSGCLAMTAIYAGKIKLYMVLRTLGIILLANLIGCIFISYLTTTAGIFNEQIMGVVIEKAIAKVHLPIGKLFISGILCNIIVCTGMCMAYSCREEITKIIVLWLSISVFVLTGTEHVVANMYYLFTAYFGGAEISLLEILYNLSVSALGNFVGGGIVVAGTNYIIGQQS